MRSRKLLGIVAVFALALVFLSAVFLARFWSSLQAAEQLVLTITAVDLAGKSKATFLLGEPVQLLFHLENQSDQDVTGDFWLGYDFNRLRLFLKKEGQDFGQYVSPKMDEAKTAKTGSGLVTLKAKGGSIEMNEFISFNVLTQDFAFPEGDKKYQIRAQFFYQGHQKQLTSDEIEIIVALPASGSEDETALKFLIDNKLKPFLTPEAPISSHDNDTVLKLQEFLKKFEKSTYAPYAKLGLEAMCKGREQELAACQA